MKQEEKIDKLVELYKEIRDLFPDNSISLMIHRLEIKELDENSWEIEAHYNKTNKTVYLTGKHKTIEGITLFD